MGERDYLTGSDLVTILLSSIEPGTDIRYLDKKLQEGLRPYVVGEEPNALLSEHFPFHPTYDDSVELHEAVRMLRQGGILTNAGNDFSHDYIERSLRACAERAKPVIGDEDYQQLQEIGNKILGL